MDERADASERTRHAASGQVCKYRGVDALQVVEVDRPVPAPGQFLLKVRATAINPGT
jgi:NADPH:quinone reductase-like Zn-dependent oxidoreductase